MELLEAAKGRQNDAIKRDAIAQGLVFNGKGDKLDKMFPGQKKRGGRGISQEEHPLGLEPPEREAPAEYAPGEDDAWMDEAMSHFQPAD